MTARHHDGAMGLAENKAIQRIKTLPGGQIDHEIAAQTMGNRWIALVGFPPDKPWRCLSELLDMRDFLKERVHLGRVFVVFHLRDIALINHRSHDLIRVKRIGIKISDEFLFTRTILSP